MNYANPDIQKGGVAMDYGEILKKAWNITWKHKGLWILGILAGCSSNRGGSGGSSGSSSQYNLDASDMYRFEHEFSHSPIIQWLSDIPEVVWIAIAIGFVFFIIALSILFWVLASIGKSGLFAAFKQADETGETSLKEAFSSALRSFWKILIIEVAVGILSFIVIVVLLLPMIICFPLLCLIIPAFIALHVIVLLIQISVVADEIHLTKAPGYIWNMVKANVGDTIVIALILGVIQLIIGLLIGLPIIFMLAPALLGFFINQGQMLGIGVGLSVVFMLIYLPVSIILSGVLQTFVHGAWTLFYQRAKDKMLIVDETEPESSEEE